MVRTRRSLHVVEQRHEPKVHVQLHVTMEQRQTGIVRDKIHLHLLEATQHRHILYDTRGMSTADLSNLKAVPVQVHRVYIVRVKETRGMIDSIIGLSELHFYVEDLQAIGFVYRFEDKIYVITAAAKDDYGLSKLKTLRIALVLGFTSAILLTVMAGSFFSGRVLRPVSEMVEKVEAITASNLDMRIGAGNGKDEMAELAQTFNRMLDRLENSFNAQKDFVSNISHELRTPLAAIIAELEVSAIRERTNEEYRTMSLLILADARKVSRLSNDLLDLAKASYDQSGITFKEARLDEVLLDATQWVLKLNPGYRIELIFEKEPEEHEGMSINGNEYLLKVAFANLIENACKFSGNHHCVVTISVDRKDPVLRFSDTGVGISPEDLDNIFTPFFRGGNKKYVEGNGIGLSLTAKIMQLHQGSVSVKSTIGVGTTITVQLPRLGT